MEWFAIVIVIFACFTPDGETRNLIQTNLIWRHGARSSDHTYPNDPYEEVWKDGSKQLTEVGLRQEYDLGAYLHSRYGHLLSSKYREGEIYIKSTDTDRAIMSAQCVAAGLYSPLNDSNWNGMHTNWRPVPIHVESKERDWLYQYNYNPGQTCNQYEALQQKLQSSSWFKENEDTYVDFYQKLTKSTGFNQTLGFHSVTPIYDNLVCLKSNGNKLPKWADDEVMNTLDHLAGMRAGLGWTDINFKYRQAMSKLRTGVVLQKMLENMKSRIEGSSTYSFVGYSAHAHCVTPTLVSLGSYNWIAPPFSACVMLELYQDDNSSYSVELWYRNSSDHEPYELTFYECGHSCSFEEFEKIASRYTQGNRQNSLCGNSGYKDKCCEYLLVGLGIFAFSTIFFIVSHCLIIRKRRKKQTYEVLPLDESEHTLINSST